METFQWPTGLGALILVLVVLSLYACTTPASTHYQNALAAERAGSPEQALHEFRAAGSYRDASARSSALQHTVAGLNRTYNAARREMRQGDLSAAEANLTSIATGYPRFRDTDRLRRQLAQRLATQEHTALATATPVRTPSVPATIVTPLSPIGRAATAALAARAQATANAVPGTDAPAAPVTNPIAPATAPPTTPGANVPTTTEPAAAASAAALPATAPPIPSATATTTSGPVTTTTTASASAAAAPPVPGTPPPAPTAAALTPSTATPTAPLPANAAAATLGPPGASPSAAAAATSGAPTAPAPAADRPATVSTLAGSGQFGDEDGPAGAARFSWPQQPALAADGSVVVADSLGNDVRRVSPDGTVSTLAGSGVRGDVDGRGAVARFDDPRGVVIDASGAVYIGDRGNDRIRRISPAGVVTNFAGGQEGFVDGPPEDARFSGPEGLAIDAGGNIYVADSGNNRIRKIDPLGRVTTVAGSGRDGDDDGPAAIASFSHPSAVTVDENDNIYVADRDNNRIRRITPDGRVDTLAGSGAAGYADGKATSARFKLPWAIAVDRRGVVYVADNLNHRIRAVAPDGTVTTVAGSGPTGPDVIAYADGAGGSARFTNPTGIAVSADGSRLIVTEAGNHLVREIVLGIGGK